MLAIDGGKKEDTSTCRIKLPPEMAGFFDEEGYVGTVIEEQRSNARLRVRCHAVMESTYAPPFLLRTEKQAHVLVKDLSRSGIGVLHHQQMYPTERFSIEFRGRKLSATVVRCRKLGESCFEIGAKIDSVESL